MAAQSKIAGQNFSQYCS